MVLSPSLRTTAAFGVLILLIAILIAGLMTGFSLDQKQASFWDVVLKAVGGIIALAGAGGTVYKYFEEKAKETEEKARANRAAQIEADKPFFEKRQQVYWELCNATSLIGNNDPDTLLRQKGAEQFWLLYWGGLPMVLDENVASIVDNYHDFLLDHPTEMVELRNRSMTIARACRHSLGYTEQ